QGSQFLVRFATGLSARGIDAVTFNFAYTEHGRRIPDPNRKLEACYRAAIETVRNHEKLGRDKLAIGGKSMGGRIASQVAAAGDATRRVDGQRRGTRRAHGTTDSVLRRPVWGKPVDPNRGDAGLRCRATGHRRPARRQGGPAARPRGAVELGAGQGGERRGARGAPRIDHFVARCAVGARGAFAQPTEPLRSRSVRKSSRRLHSSSNV